MRSTLDLGAAWIFLCGVVASIWTGQSSSRDTGLTIMAVCVVPVMLIHAFRARILALCRVCCRRRTSEEQAARKLKTDSGVAADGALDAASDVDASGTAAAPAAASCDESPAPLGPPIAPTTRASANASFR